MPAPEPDPYATVDPSWGPPRPTGTSDPPGTPAPDRGPRWLPLVAVVLVTVLAAGGMFAAGRVGAATSATAASVYLPADGQAAYQQRSTTVGSETVTSTEVQESAVRTGLQMLGGVDWTLGLKISAVVGSDHPDRMRLWRTTGSEIGDLGSSQQDVHV
jgi:hypothetical protein